MEVAASTKPPAPVAKRRGRRRALAIVLAVLALALTSAVASGLWWIRTDDFQAKVVPLVIAAVNERTGEELELERIDVRTWPPAIEATGVRLVHPATGEAIADVARVYAPLVLRGGSIQVGRLAIDSPTLELHIEADGKLREFRSARKGSTPMRTFPWNSLEVRDGAFRLFVPDGRVVVTDLQVAPTVRQRADVSGTLVLMYRDLDDYTAFSWPGVALGPDRVEIPSLEVVGSLFQLRGRAQATLEGAYEAELRLGTDLDRYTVLLGERRALHGLADVDLAVAGQGADAQAEVAVRVQDLIVELPGRTVPVIHYRIGDVTAAILATPDEATVERAIVKMGDGTVEVWGRVTRDLAVHDGHAIAEGLSLEHLLTSMDAAPHPWTDFTGDAEISFAGTLKPMLLEGPFDLTVLDWNTGDRPISDPDVHHLLKIPRAHGSGTLRFEGNRLWVDATEVQGPRSHGRATADVGLGPHGPLDLRFDLDRADLSDFQPLGDSGLAGVGTVSGRLWGPFNKMQLAGDGDVHGFEVVGVRWADHLVSPIASPDMKRLVLTDARAELGDTRYAGNFSLDFRDPMTMQTDIVVTEGRVTDLTGMFVELPGVEGDIEGTLTLEGPLFDLDGEVHVSLANVDLYGERFPTGEGHAWMDQGLFTLDDLRVTRYGGRAGVVVRGSVQRDYALNMEVVGDGFALERLDHLQPYGLPLTGRVGFVARVDNKIYDPAPHGFLRVTDVRYDGTDVADSVVRFHTTDAVTTFGGTLVGKTVALEGTVGLWNEQPYAVRADLVDFPISTLYPAATDGSPVRGTVTGALSLAGTFGDEPAPIELSAEIAEVVATWQEHTLRNTAPWVYHQHGDAFELEGFSLVGGPPSKLPTTRVALERAARTADGLDMRGSGRVDLDLLRMFVPGLERSEGQIDLTLTALGRAPDIDTVIDAEVYGSVVRHWSFPGTFEDVRATVHATRDGFDLLDVTASLGGGTLDGGGRISAADWVPRRYDLRAEARGAQVQWIEALPPAIGDARLTFDGPVGALLLSGDVEITEMPFLERIDWEDWVVEYRDWALVDAAPTETDPWFSIDLQITADDTITLRNNVAEGVATADLQVIGDTSRAGLMGEIALSDTVAFLQDREFVVDRGLLTWRDPWTWDPDLHFDLVTDITSQDQRYRVSVLVRGPFSDWRTETRSEPPLAQADINTLLWFGVTADELEESGDFYGAIAQGVADMILTDFFVTRFGGVGDDLRLFDRFEIATGVDSRGEYDPDPRLIVAKQVTDRVDATVETGLNGYGVFRGEFKLQDNLSLAAWYSTVQRDRALPFGGAVGLDVRWRAESD